MTSERCLYLLSLYEAKLKELHDAPPEVNSFGRRLHTVRGALPYMRALLAKGDHDPACMSEFLLQLGFAQGVLFSCEVYTYHEIQEHMNG